MGRILVTPEDLADAATLLRRRGQYLRGAGHELDGTLHTLSWEVRQRVRIEDEGGEAVRHAVLLADRLEELAAFLTDCSTRFAAADGAAVDAKRLRSLLERSQGRLDALVPPWALPGAPLRNLVGLGTLLWPSASIVPHANLWAVDRFLRSGVGPVPGQVKAKADAIANLAAVIGVKRAHYGSPEREGLSFGQWSVSAPSLSGMDVSVDAARYQIAGGPVQLKVDAGHVSAGYNSWKYDEKGLHGRLSVGAEASVLEAEMETTLVGDENVNLALVSSGEVLTANGELSIGPDGVAVEAMAAVVHGETGVELHIFDWSVELGFEGCAACAGVSTKLGWTGELALGAGLGLGFKWAIKPK